jgi:hypothetical protein
LSAQNLEGGGPELKNHVSQENQKESYVSQENQKESYVIKGGTFISKP